MLASVTPAASWSDNTPGALSQFSPDADWQAIADRLYESNCALVARTEALQKALQEKQLELDVQSVQARSLEEAQATEATAAEAALQACQARDREQLRAIATLSERLEIAQIRAEQLEKECLALQATCREQTERTTCAQKEIQELHGRLQQQQQQTASAQAALEGHLAEIASRESRSNAWPPPIINLSEGDRPAVKAVAENPGAEDEEDSAKVDPVAIAMAATGIEMVAVSADPWQEELETFQDTAIDLDDPQVEARSEESLVEQSESTASESLDATAWFAPMVQQRPVRKKRQSLAAISLPEF